MSQTAIVRVSSLLALTLGVLAVGARPAMAQLNGFHLRGDAGLQAGTQAPPAATTA